MMRAFNDPMGGTDPLVDKMIGNAYDTVALVAKNLQELLYLGQNMDDLSLIANSLRISTMVEGIAGQLGELVSIPLPVGIQQSKLQSSSVMVTALDGTIYTADSGYFTSYIKDGALKFAMKLMAPVDLIGAPVRWFVSYGV